MCLHVLCEVLEDTTIDVVVIDGEQALALVSTGNAEMVVESYEWFLAHRDRLDGAGRSHHQSPARLGALRLLKRLP